MKTNRLILLFSAVALIFGATVLTFCRCFDYGLINLDDYYYLLGHPEVVQFDALNSLRWMFTDVSESIWMPLSWASYALDYRLFGTWYGGFHLHAVLLHAINAVLVYRLLSLLFPTPQPPNTNHQAPTTKHLCCLLAALFWAVHPLRCESVVFLASRKDILSFFWELLALIAWIHGSRCGALNRRVLLTALSILLFAFGAMSKPSVMTFPLLCLLLDVFVIRCVRPMRYVIPVGLMIFLGAFAAWQQSVGGATLDGAQEPLWARLAVSASAFGIYIRNTIFPLWLAPQCIKQWPSMPRFLCPGIIISVLWDGYLLKRALHYWSLRRETVSVERLDGCPVALTFANPADYLFAGMAWFALAIAPMLGIANFGYHAFADRFTYIPSFGLAILLAAGLNAVLRRFGTVKALLPTFAALVALGMTACWQTGFWRNDLTLFSRTLEVDGDRNTLAQKIVAMHHFEVDHDLEKSRFHFDKARATDVESLLNVIDVYAITLVELGKDDEASDLLQEVEKSLVKRYDLETAYKIIKGAFDLPPREGLYSDTLRMARVACALGKEKSLDEARSDLDRLRLSQEEAAIWQYLMWKCLSLSGEKAAADAAWKRLIDPSDKVTYIQFRYLRERHRGS